MADKKNKNNFIDSAVEIYIIAAALKLYSAGKSKVMEKVGTNKAQHNTTA